MEDIVMSDNSTGHLKESLAHTNLSSNANKGQLRYLDALEATKTVLMGLDTLPFNNCRYPRVFRRQVE